MNKNTKLETIINKLIKVSLISGKLNTVKVKEVTKVLSGLSVGNAIKSLDLYLSGLKRELDSHRLIIESPIKLSDDQINKIKEIVESTTPVYDMEIVIKPNLLAGFKIQIGDQVYEDSLDDRIRKLKEAIHE